MSDDRPANVDMTVFAFNEGAGPVSQRRWIKQCLSPKMPAKWLARFVFSDILQRGFLEGITGFRFCLFPTAYELLIDLNPREIELDKRRARRGKP